MTKSELKDLMSAVFKERAVKEAELELAKYTMECANDDCKILNDAINMQDETTLLALAHKFSVKASSPHLIRFKSMEA